ncbi:MAG: N-acetylmuramyl-L-alanine amidase, negative regulator of AmpC, AmpD [Bacteroidota bacterium]|jgi:spore germination protein YaaH|nr:N-acetylmuramyl-L-alanine amidase, negative regulator of AmpC, AmpD [Bacteroidota bacterium]
MNLNFLLFTLLLPVFISAQQSTIQEQSNHYRNFAFTKDTQWDSLNSVENGTVYHNDFIGAKTNSTCTLKKKVYGWHPYWVGSVYTNYDWSMLSDFCYFDYAVSPTTGNNTNTSFAWASSAAVTAAISNSVNVHFCATLFGSHSTFWGSPSAQQTFITNAINLLNSRPGSNGINIDFEGMGSSDKAPFASFMTNLCNQVHAANSNYKVTMALYAVEWGSNTFDIAALNPIVDNFIIMGYDYYYSGSTTAGPEAPLYNFQTTYNYTLAKSITHYLNKGVSKNKLLLGLPWYGREWETVGATAPSSTTGGFTTSRTYNAVRNNPGTYSAANKKWESNSFENYYSYQSSGTWRQCWIDDNYTYSRKFDLVNQRGIGGIGIWALGYDDGYSDLWNLINDKFSSCATVACTDSIFDMGGPARNYYDSENYIYTIAPTGASKVNLNFSYVRTEANYDTLFVYDGSSAASPTLGVYTGTTNTAFTLSSTTPSVTIRFKSDGGTVSGGFKAVYNCVQDNAIPTTQITVPGGWITQNFTTSYTDADNAGGTGIEKSFYLPSYYNGIEWRANGNRGFFQDDFTGPSIHPDWTTSAGTWSATSGALLQTDETNANTNIYANVAQNLSNRYLYCFKGTISGANTNRRAGIYIACDAPSQTQRGNSYMIWFRPDQSSVEFYKSIANSIGLPTYSAACTIVPGTTYDYKISYDRITGEIKVWQNNAFVASWTDTTPHANGTAVSFRSGNSTFKIDDFKIFRSRAASHTLLVGATNSNDLRNENPAPSVPAGKISSITKDNANNLSTIASQTLNIDWTKPQGSLSVKDGAGTDIDTTFTGTQLAMNYTAAKDTNSAVNTYYYAIGTTAGSQNIVSWTNNALNLSATKTGLSLINNQKYFIMVKAKNGAGLMSDSTISDGVIYLMSTSIEDQAAAAQIAIYPNPASDYAHISLVSQNTETLNYTLMDVNGKNLEEKRFEVNSGVNTLEIPLKSLHLSKGVYFIKIKSEEKQWVRKLIID